MIETDFMSRRIDDPAAPIAQKIVEGGLLKLTDDEKSDFSRFVLSLRVRHPDAVALAREEGERTLRAGLDRDPEEYLAAKAATSPPTFGEWVEKNAEAVIPNFGMSLLPKVIADDAIGERLFRSRWATYDARKANTDFLIGDRPCLLSGNAVSGDFTIALPLSPKILLLIASHPDRIDIFRSGKQTDVVKRINKLSVTEAAQRVFASGTHHMPLIAKHLGVTKRSATPSQI